MPPFSLTAARMANPVLKAIIRTRFRLTSRQGAITQTRKYLREYLQLAQGLDELSGGNPVRVPSMIGVDDDMREWSFFMLLRHNTIVNHAISGTVIRLVRGEPEPTRKFDVKKDVMPERDCGVEQIAVFESSVQNHLDALEKLGSLRGTETKKHPVFGPLDAHGWTCLFAFHLSLHLKQAQRIRAGV